MSTHENLQHLGKNNSLSDLTNKYTKSRQVSGHVFAELREHNPGLELYAQCGEEPNLQSRVFFNLSFCTQTCVKNCLDKYGPDTVIMTDNSNTCVKKTRTGALSSTFRKGGTIGPFTNEHAEAFCNKNIGQGDFYRFNSTGNDWPTMLADMENLYNLTASDHFTFEQFMDIVNLDSVNDMIFRQAINYVASGEEFIMVQWSSRNYEMAFDCPRAMFKSENGIVTYVFLGHPAWSSQGGLKRLVLFIGGTYACLFKCVYSHVPPKLFNIRCNPNEVNRFAKEFGYFASLFNGTHIENEDGTTTILQAEPINNWFLWMAGLVDGSPYEEERKHEAESRKLMSADISDGHVLVKELEETTDLSEEDILDKVQKRYGIPARKHVKFCLDKRNVLVEYHKLMAEPGMDRETALSKLEQKYKKKKYKKKSVISWLSHVTSRSAAKADYEKLMLQDMDHAKALAELKQKYTEGVMKWLSDATSRSAAKAEYKKLILQDDMDLAKA